LDVPIVQSLAALDKAWFPSLWRSMLRHYKTEDADAR